MASVLLVSYHYAPSAAVGARRAARFARHLAGSGHDVHVVCGSMLPSDASDQAYSGLSRADRSQLDLVHDEARVSRVPTRFPFGRDPSQDISALTAGERMWWKVRAYAEALLPMRSWEALWGLDAARQARPLIEGGHVDVVIVSVPPGRVVHESAALAHAHGIPVVADFRDLLRPSYEKVRSSRRRFPADHARRRASDAALLELYRISDRIVFSSEEAAEYAKVDCDYVDAGRVRHVTNAFDRVDDEVEVSNRDDQLELVYSGSLAYGREAQLIRFLAGLGAMRVADDPLVRLSIVGSAGPNVRAAVQEYGLEDRVNLHGWLPRERVTEIQRSADALLLLQPPGEPRIEMAIPAKLFEYMERRKSVLSLAPTAGDRVVREHDLGVVARAGTPTQVADSLRELARMVRERPVLPPPPDVFSSEKTSAEFWAIVESCL